MKEGESKRKYAFRLDELEGFGRDLIGGKAVGLVALHLNGFPSPETAVITTNAYRDYVVERGLGRLGSKKSGKERERLLRESFTLETLDRRDTVISNVESEVRDIFPQMDSRKEPFSPGLAVRSSATLEDSKSRSYAGTFYTALNVRNSKAFRYSILKCWASASRPELMRERNSEMTDVGMALVIQEMLDPDASGVVFTEMPKQKNYVLIEAVWGLGKGAVNGTVRPDTALVDLAKGEVNTEIGEKSFIYRLKKEGGTIRESAPARLQRKQCLDDAQAESLARACKRAESALGYPLDIEWSLVGSKIYFLQARPIPGLRL